MVVHPATGRNSPRARKAPSTVAELAAWRRFGKLVAGQNENRVMWRRKADIQSA
jgi:hypothetical protein